MVFTHCTLLSLPLVDTFFGHPFLDQTSNIKKCENNDLVVMCVRARELSI